MEVPNELSLNAARVAVDACGNFTTSVRNAVEDILNFTRPPTSNGSAEYANRSAPAGIHNKIPSLLANITNAAFNAAASAVMASESSSISHVDIPSRAAEVPHVRLEHAPQLTTSSLIKVYVLMTMAVVSLIGNVATMWNIYKTRMARRGSRHSWSAIYTLIFHLSIADVIVTGFCIVGDAVWYYTVQWLAGDLCCKLVKLFQMFGLYLSTYVLVLIGVDRWIAVKYPMKSLNMAKRCYRLLGGIYVLSFVLSVPQYFIFRVKKGPFIEDFHQCVTHGFYAYDWQEQFYTTFTMVFMFLLPLAILFGSYLSTFRTISDSEQMFQGSKLAIYSNKKPSMQTNRQRLIHKAKMKSLRISIVIIFAFLICWTPYNVMMIIFIFLNPDKNFSEDLQKGIFFFGMANSLVNPLIYGAFHLCPTNRKAKNSSFNNKYSLTRGDSQRTPSMLSAVTQVDNSHRPSRSFRQASYFRTYSNGSHKEHVGLLPTSVCLTSLKNYQHSNNLQQQQHQKPFQDKVISHGSRAGSLCILSTSNGTTITTKTVNGGTNLSIPDTDNLKDFIDPTENISRV